jgi:hypothetical protein
MLFVFGLQEPVVARAQQAGRAQRRFNDERGTPLVPQTAGLRRPG